MKDLTNKTNQELEKLLAENASELIRIADRLTNPMASEETIRNLHRSQNERLADEQQIKIELAKRAETYPLAHTAKPFERSLNESEARYGIN